MFDGDWNLETNDYIKKSDIGSLTVLVWNKIADSK